MKRLHVVNHRRFISSMSVLIFLFGIVLSLVAFNLSSSADTPVHWEQVVVQEGDTLWHLAGNSADEGQDVRCVIDTIMSYNHLSTPDIHPGETLFIPHVESHNLVADSQ